MMKTVVVFLLGNVAIISMMMEARGVETRRLGGRKLGGFESHGNGGRSGGNGDEEGEGQFPPFGACSNLTETLCPSCTNDPYGPSLESCLAECIKSNEAAFEEANCGPKPPGGKGGSYPTPSNSCWNATKTLCANCTNLSFGAPRWTCFMSCFAANLATFAADCGPVRPPGNFTEPPTGPFTRWPTTAFTRHPTRNFTHWPTIAFTRRPTRSFTHWPTVAFTQRPTFLFTQRPTAAFTQRPTGTFTHWPTVAFTQRPTIAFTQRPTVAFTQRPTAAFTHWPTSAFTQRPTVAFTQRPTGSFTQRPFGGKQRR